MRTSFGEKRFLRCTHAHPTKNGGRQPAVVRIRAWNGDRLFQTECVCPARSFPAPRGAYAPRSCAAMRTSFGGKTIFAMHKRRSDQERRASARRGSADTFTQTPARFLARPPRVCVPITIAIACSDTTGGLRPPLLCCDANVCRRKNDFCDAQTHIRPRAAGVSPPWFGFALATASDSCGLITFRPAQSPPGATAGSRQPLLG
jgi:hypothetical protein